MISILIPERGRPEKLVRLIKSLHRHAGDDQNHEILIAFDDDDPAWDYRVLDDDFQYPRFRKFCWPRPITLGAKLNMLAEQALGDVLCFIANDMVMETPGWPAKIQAAADSLAAGIGVPFLNSTLSPGMPTYPVITRKMMEAVGHFMDPSYPFWFIDTCWQDIGLMVGSLFSVDVTVSAPDGIGLTHGMVDLPFWVDYFVKTRIERVQIAERLLGGPVPPERIAECIRQTAHLWVSDFLMRWGRTAESPPGPRYGEAKTNAERHMTEMGSTRLTAYWESAKDERVPSRSTPHVDSNRARYLDLLESVLTGTITRDPSMDPWSPPDFDLARRATGRDWPATALTMIGSARMRQLREACEEVLRENIPGDFIECGVWRGGACIYMAAILEAWGDTERTVWAADSFQGLPLPVYGEDRGDLHHTYTQLAVSQAEVESNFNRFEMAHRIRPLAGWFKDSLPAAHLDQLAILRLDGDMYESTKTALDALYPKLSIGGICIIDDFHLAGCRTAVTEYRGAHGITSKLWPIDGLGVWWRRD